MWKMLLELKCDPGTHDADAIHRVNQCLH
jgi:hypothetical protein